MPFTPEEPWTLANFVIVPDSVEVSACKIEEIVRDRVGHHYSHATVSRITEVVNAASSPVTP